MRLRPAAVPSVDPVPAPADGGLLEREQSALDAERAIALDADALARSLAQLAADARALSDRAARLQQAGHPEAEWLLARFHSHRLECPDLSGPSSQALAARNQALAARARAVEAARVLLQASASALDEHRAGLARDAAELERVEAAAEEARAELARKQAARREMEQREAQARARREAQTAAGAARAADAAPQPEPSRAAQAAGPVRPRPGSQALGKMSAPGSTPIGRAGARIPLKTQVNFSSDSNLFTGFSTDIGEGGLFVATVNLLPVGTPVDLTFTLPGEASITVQGEVRWTRELDERSPQLFPGVGVRFLELRAEAAQALHRFVAEREPLFYPD